MELNNKKITFSFSKVSKFSGTQKQTKPKSTKDIEFIDCLDSQTIVVKNGTDIEQEKEIVIPLPKCENVEDKGVLSKIKAVSANSNNADALKDQETSLEDIAIKEIIQESQNTNKTSEDISRSSHLVLKYKRGEYSNKESTLEDYENIPISHYGKAMLRGMGWSEGKGIGKNERVVSTAEPQVRPRGMGLGADKLVSLSAPPESEEHEELKLMKGACVKLLYGSRKGHYGKIEGFNEDSGRVIIRAALDSANVSVTESAFKLVSNEEYSKNFRVLNVRKYEDYKLKEDGKII